MNRFLKLDSLKGHVKFEHLMSRLLPAIIAAIVGPATWWLIVHTSALIRDHIYQTQPAVVLALAAASLSLGIVAQEK